MRVASEGREIAMKIKFAIMTRWKNLTSGGIRLHDHRHTTLSLTVVIAAIAVLTSSAAPARAQGSLVRLVSTENGKCLQPINGSANPGDAIVQEPCNGSAAQSWSVVSVSGKLHFVNSSSQLCLDARGGAANGTPIQQWTCDQITNENWRTSTANNWLTSAVSNTSSFCLATTGDQDASPMQLQSCAITPAQLWVRQSIGTPTPPVCRPPSVSKICDGTPQCLPPKGQCP